MSGPEERSGSVLPTPMLRLPHLADAAKRLGCEERPIRVDLPTPPVVRTPGRGVGQWLASGARLPDINAFAAATVRDETACEREEFER